MSHPASGPLPSSRIARRRKETPLSSRSSPWLLWPYLGRLLMSSPVVFLLSSLSLLSLLSVHYQEHQRRGETHNQQALKHPVIHLSYPGVTTGHAIVIKLFIIVFAIV